MRVTSSKSSIKCTAEIRCAPGSSLWQGPRRRVEARHFEVFCTSEDPKTTLIVEPANELARILREDLDLWANRLTAKDGLLRFYIVGEEQWRRLAINTRIGSAQTRTLLPAQRAFASEALSWQRTTFRASVEHHARRIVKTFMSDAIRLGLRTTPAFLDDLAAAMKALGNDAPRLGVAIALALASAGLDLDQRTLAISVYIAEHRLLETWLQSGALQSGVH
jgi:hypothetical protein